jgi:hypothetical protein
VAARAVRRFEVISLLALVLSIVGGPMMIFAVARALDPSTAAQVAWEQADGGPHEVTRNEHRRGGEPTGEVTFEPGAPRDLTVRPILDPWGRAFAWECRSVGDLGGLSRAVRMTTFRVYSRGFDPDLSDDDIGLSPYAPRPTAWLRFALEEPRATSAIALVYLYTVAWWLRLPRLRTRRREVVVAALAGLPLLPLALGLGQLERVRAATPAHLVVQPAIAIGAALWSLAFVIALAIRLLRREAT